MQIVVATQSLVSPGGCETYTVTVADHLQRLGHDVWLHALEHGDASAAARDLGLRVAAGEDALPPAPDALLVQDGAVAYALADRHPRVPQVLVAHSDVFDLSLPPNLPGMTAAVVTLYDRAERRVRGLAQEHRIVRLAQPIDVERFKPTSALPERPRVALTLGNYVHGERAALLERACERAGLELRHLGAHGDGVAADPRTAFGEAHVVFGKARVVLEAMACGRAVYVLDHNGAEGWVTSDNRAALAADNFGGQSAPVELDEDRLVADLARYDAATGLANRDFVVAHHAATKHAAALSELLREVAPRRAPVDAPVREMARLVRVYHRADVQTYQLHAELARRDRRLHELGEELRAAHAATEASRSALDDARRATAAAERRAAELTATRRWRAVQHVMRPADRLRALVRRRPGATP